MQMNIKRKLFILLVLNTSLFARMVHVQTKDMDYEKLLQVPLRYTVLNTSAGITVNGKDNEEDWSKAPWTEFFADIESGAASNPPKKVRCKMLWGDNYLYVFAHLQETNLWASITRHDDPVFQDNALKYLPAREAIPVIILPNQATVLSSMHLPAISKDCPR